MATRSPPFNTPARRPEQYPVVADASYASNAGLPPDIWLVATCPSVLASRPARHSPEGTVRFLTGERLSCPPGCPSIRLSGLSGLSDLTI